MSQQQVRTSVDEVLQNAVDSGAVPNVAAIAADRDGVIYEGAAGPRAADGSDPVSVDTHFRIMSMTKMVATVAALVGALVPAFTYVLNHHAPWATEPAKALVLALVAAAAGALTQLLDAGGIPLTWETAQIVGTAVALAFLSHVGFWRPSSIAERLGAGSNANGAPPG